MRNYTTQHVPGAHLNFNLNFSQRQTLASDWNALVNAGCRITLRQFAAKHGLRYETWRREYLRRADRNVGLIAFPWPMRLATWWLSTLPHWLNETINRFLPAKVLN